MRISSVIFYLCAGISCSAMLDAAVAFDPLGNKDDQYNSSSKSPSRTHTDESQTEPSSYTNGNVNITSINESFRNQHNYRSFEPLPPRSADKYERRRERSNSSDKSYNTNHFNRDKRYNERKYRDHDRGRYSYDEYRQKRSPYERKYERSRDDFFYHSDRNMRDEYRYHRDYNYNRRGYIGTRYGRYSDNKSYNDGYIGLYSEHNRSVGNKNDSTSIDSVMLDTVKNVVIPNSVQNVEHSMFSDKGNIVTTEIAKEPEISLKSENTKSVSYSTIDREDARLLKVESPSVQSDDKSLMSTKAPKPYSESEKVEKKEAKNKFSIDSRYNIKDVTPEECKCIDNLKIVRIFNEEYLNAWLDSYSCINHEKRKYITIKIRYPIKYDIAINVIHKLEKQFKNVICCNVILDNSFYGLGKKDRSFIGVKIRTDNATRTAVLSSTSKQINVDTIGDGFLNTKCEEYKELFGNDVHAIVIPDSIRFIEKNAFGSKRWQQGHVTIVMPSTIEDIEKDVFSEKFALLPAIKWNETRQPSAREVKFFMGIIKLGGKCTTATRPILFQFVNDRFEVIWNVSDDGTLTKPSR